MMNSINKEIGYYGENMAEDYIKKLGYIIIERNFNCKIGEIDIIGKDGDYIVFIEVKSRYDNRYGSPCEAVTHGKQYKIYKTAQFYILKKKLYNLKFRFDVIEVKINKFNHKSDIRLIRNAFQI